MNLQGKRAIVVGGGSGIGAATVERLCSEGARVAVVDIRPDRAEQVCATVGEGAEPFVCDVREAGLVDQTFAAVVARFGGVDVLVNSAAMDADDAKQESLNKLGDASADAAYPSPSERVFSVTAAMTDKQWDDEIHGVLTSVFYCVRAALRYMIPQESGSIISVSSIHGIAGGTGLPHYSAAKAGILGFTRSVSKEVAPYGVRVNAVTSGYVATPFLLDHMPTAFQQATAKNTPLGRLGRSEEIAAVICFLAGDDSSFVTGQSISPNGGFITV